jgi:hypothetical protein
VVVTLFLPKGIVGLWDQWQVRRQQAEELPPPSTETPVVRPNRKRGSD